MKLEDLTEEQMEQLPLDELQKMIDDNNIGEKIENPDFKTFEAIKNKCSSISVDTDLINITETFEQKWIAEMYDEINKKDSRSKQ